MCATVFVVVVLLRRTFFCIVASNTSLSSSSLSSSVFGTREKRPTKTVFSKNFTRATTVTVKLRAEYERKAAISERMSKKLLAVLRKVEDIANAHEEMKALMLRNTRDDDDDDDENTTTNEDTTIERLLMEAELCQMLDRKRAEMERREKEFEMEERRHRDGVEAVLELKNKLKKEVDGAERNDDEEVLEFGDVVEEKDVLKAVSKKKEKSLDDFLNEKEEEEEEEEDNDDDESSSSTTTTNAKAKTKYGKAALLKFEKRKKELLERQRLAYEKALKKKK